MLSERGCTSLIITHNPSLGRLIWLWWLNPCGRACAVSLSVHCGTSTICSATLIAKSSGLFLCQCGVMLRGNQFWSYTVFGNKPSQFLCSSLIAWCNGEWWVGLCVEDRMSVFMWVLSFWGLQSDSDYIKFGFIICLCLFFIQCFNH